MDQDSVVAIENAGPLVTKQQVLDMVWPGTFVVTRSSRTISVNFANCGITGRRRLLPMLMVQNTEQSTV
jgi:hypothetical protein